MAMPRITSSCLPPEGSRITAGLTDPVDYADCFSVRVPPSPGATVDDLAVRLFEATPRWVDGLMRLRDLLVRPFGIKTGAELAHGAPAPPRPRHQIGDRLVFFTVSDRSDDEIVLAEDDKHLAFRTSVLVRPTADPGEVIVSSTTLVVFHNLLGRLYFFFVKPLHKLVIKSLLERFRKRLLRDAAAASRRPA